MDKTSYEQLPEVVQSLALVLMGEFNFPDTCWQYNTAQRKQSRRFLEWVEDKFLMLLFTNREGLVEDRNRLGQSNHKVVEFSILSEDLGGGEGSKTSTLEFWRADCELFRTLAGRIPWGTVLKGKGVQ